MQYREEGLDSGDRDSASVRGDLGRALHCSGAQRLSWALGWGTRVRRAVPGGLGGQQPGVRGGESGPSCSATRCVTGDPCVRSPASIPGSTRWGHEGSALTVLW